MRPINPPWRDAQRTCRACFDVAPPLAYEGPEGRARPMFHEEGSLDAQVLFVLEAPNRDDTFHPRKGRLTVEPDTDPTGAFLAELLEAEARLDLHEVLFVNAVMCLPAAKNGAYRVTARQLNTCVGHLRTTISEVRPKVVVPLGGPALRATARLEEHGLRKVSDAVGRATPWLERTLYPLVHPSRLGRVTRPEPMMRKDWRALGALLRS